MPKNKRGAIRKKEAWRRNPLAPSQTHPIDKIVEREKADPRRLATLTAVCAHFYLLGGDDLETIDRVLRDAIGRDRMRAWRNTVEKLPPGDYDLINLWRRAWAGFF